MKLSLSTILEDFDACTPSVSISKNHGHKLIISVDDITFGEQRRYDITGDADHHHVVDITVDNFEQLSSGEALELDSSHDVGHIHMIKISCKPFRQDHPNVDQPRNALINPSQPTRKKGY